MAGRGPGGDRGGPTYVGHGRTGANQPRGALSRGAQSGGGPAQADRGGYAGAPMAARTLGYGTAAQAEPIAKPPARPPPTPTRQLGGTPVSTPAMRLFARWWD